MYRVTKVAITTDGSGDATVYGEAGVGLLHAFVYTPGDIDTGADLTITDEATGAALVTVTNGGTTAVTIMPRGGTANTSNAAALYASGGTGVLDKLPIVGRVKCVVAAGGDTKVGALSIIWDDGC